MLSRLSTEHVLQLLDCLRCSYKLACDFDLRPGLKFLIQKVAHTEVAVNLYKQAGASMVFYIHTLIKICSNIPSLSLASVRTLLSVKTKESQTGREVSSTMGEADVSASQESSSVMSSGDETKSLQKNSAVCTDIGDDERDIGAAEIKSSKDNTQTSDKIPKFDTPVSSSQTFSLKAKKPKLDICKPFKQGTKVIENPSFFVSQLQSVCEELCQTYIDILYDKEGTSCVDNMAEQQLFFLIAQPDEFPDIPNKPDLSGLSGQLEQTQARLQGLTMTQPVSVQSPQGKCALQLQHQKVYLPTFVPDKDSDQPAFSYSLIRIFTGCLLDSHGCKFYHADSEESDQTAQTTNLCRAHMSEGTFFCITDKDFCKLHRASKSCLIHPYPSHGKNKLRIFMCLIYTGCMGRHDKPLLRLSLNLMTSLNVMVLSSEYGRCLQSK